MCDSAREHGSARGGAGNDPSYSAPFLLSPPYFLNVHPRKSKPSAICAILVFSGDRVRPRTRRKSSITNFASSSVSFVAPVTTKSSAYRTRFTLALTSLPPIRRVTKCFRKTVSSPSNAILANVGEIIPPCGVPALVGNIWPFQAKPHFNHFRSTALSIGMLASNQSSRIIHEVASNRELGCESLSLLLDRRVPGGG